MAVAAAWVSTSPRDKVSLDAALTQLADRQLAYRQSVEAIANAFAGTTGADLVTMGYDATVGPTLAAAFATLLANAQDTGVATIIGKLRNVGR